MQPVTDEQILSLLTDLESERAERTRSTSDTDKFCKAICAFSNDLPNHRKPGVLFVGIEKDGMPTGIDVTEKLLEALASHRSNGQIIPIPTMSVRKMTHQSGDFAVIVVHPSEAPPVRYKGQTWIRVGPRQATATLEEERRLTERRVDRARTWDMQSATGCTLDDLSLDLFTLNYLPQAIAPDVLSANGRGLKEQLAALRFYDEKRQMPTNGGVLLFGKDPLSIAPGAYVQYVRYDGITKVADALSERRISGDMLSVMRRLDELAEQVATTRPLRQPDLKDISVSEYPKLALHELFMNAVIHRNYEGSTTPVSIDHYMDRIEVSNPGSLFGDLTREQFPNGTAYRNPLLAEAAKTLGFVNRFGRGIAIVQDQLQRNGSPPATFTIGPNHLLVAILKRP